MSVRDDDPIRGQQMLVWVLIYMLVELAVVGAILYIAFHVF